MSHVCPWWLAYTFDNRLRSLLHSPEKVLCPYVGPGMTVMDTGCGMGVFSIGMADLVGDDGLVIAVDIQKKMLEVVERRAEKAGIKHRIRTHLCGPETLGNHKNVHFALAFWMVHEVERPRKFFEQIHSCLGRESLFLLVEPKLHVSANFFNELVKEAQDAGFKPCAGPCIRLSRAALFYKDGV